MGSNLAGPAVPVARLQDCVNVILSYQNPPSFRNTAGGWATYERTRSYKWVEFINPAETFGGAVQLDPGLEAVDPTLAFSA